MAVLRDHLEATLKSRIKDEDGAVANYLPIYNDWTKITAAEESAGVTPVNYAYPPGDVRRYGASTSATNATNRQAIQDAIDSSDVVRIPESYTINSALNLRSNVTIHFDGGAIVTLAGGVTTEHIFHGDTVDNVRFVDATIRGNGLAGISAVFLEDCTDVSFDRCDIKYAGGMAILLRTCTRILVDSCELSENYGYGIEDKNGTRNIYTNNRCFGNGDTGTASNSGGRGILLWMCVDCVVSDNSFVANTEYGFRIYGEAADASASYGNRVIGNFFQDNVSADLVLYDESLTGSLVLRNVLSGNIAVRTTVPTLGQSFLLHGGDNTVENCHVYKEGTFGAFDAYYLYYAVRTKVVNCTASNLANCVIFSNSQQCVVDGFVGQTVATAAGAAGFSLSGNVIRNSEFTHGGAGAADVGIVTYNATGRNYIENVILDGFNYGIYIGNEAVTIKHVTTTNSNTDGFRKDGTVLDGQEFWGNSFDSSNPAVLQNIDRLEGRPAVVRYTAEPSTLTWTQGDLWVKTNPAAGGIPGGACVTSGTFSAATDNTGDTDGSTAVITGMTDTSDFFVGEYVTVSAGFASTGPFQIVAKTASTITVDANSNSAQSNVTVETPDPVFKNDAARAA